MGLVLCALLLAEAWSLRRRWRVVIVLPPASSAAVEDAEIAVITPDAAPVAPEVRAAAAAAMHAQALDALDLVPGTWDTGSAFDFVRMLDPARARSDRRAPGRTAGHALATTPALARSSAPAEDGDAPAVPAEIVFLRRARELRRCAPAMAYAVAPALPGRRSTPEALGGLLRELFGPATPIGLAVPLVVVALIAWAFVLNVWGGLAALAAFQLQPAIALWRGPVRCPDLARHTLLRLPIDVVRWKGIVRGGRGWRRARDQWLGVLRSTYDGLLAGGTAPFFEPRVVHCPLCGSGALAALLASPDRYQRKPGRFVLERCGDCGHVFQNPRLTLDGLAFYYRDFYDGLGEAGSEFVFSADAAPYLARARAVAAHVEPSAWLDVGAGHGHFCLTARAVLPRTRFDGLDIGAGIRHAIRRGWVDRGIHGLFPEHAPALAGQYDVVSMSHYLEHTRDPRAEIAAAFATLRPGGFLLIEVPDPTSRMGRVLRSYWAPWFQPQHQHFLTPQGCAALLAESGFEVIALERRAAHGRVDLAFAAFLWLRNIAPLPDWPWRPPPSAFAHVRYALTLLLGWPLLLCAWMLDRMLGPALARPGWSNAYRILARRTDA